MVKLSYTTKETQACASKNMKNRISQKKMLCCREMFGRNALRRHIRMEN
jgi:hypothetical protein